MVHNTLGLQHVEARKRWFKKLERFPHPGRFKGFLDRIIYVVAILSILMTIPQITVIWIGKNAAGVSPISWGFYAFGDIFWLMYGVAHKSKPILISYFGALLVNLLVVFGALIYG